MAYTYPFKGTDEATKLKVWAKGKAIKDFDEKVWRHDTCGKVMKYSEHGNTDSEYGWESQSGQSRKSSERGPYPDDPVCE